LLISATILPVSREMFNAELDVGRLADAAGFFAAVFLI